MYLPQQSSSLLLHQPDLVLLQRHPVVALLLQPPGALLQLPLAQISLGLHLPVGQVVFGLQLPLQPLSLDDTNRVRVAMATPNNTE